MVVSVDSNDFGLSEHFRKYPASSGKSDAFMDTIGENFLAPVHERKIPHALSGCSSFSNFVPRQAVIFTPPGWEWVEEKWVT